MSSSRVGVVQFELELGDARVRVPWEGRSPRGLTRGALMSIFKTQGAKSTSGLFVPGQIEIWPEVVKGLPASPGAPLLLPLKRRLNRG